MTDLTPGDPSDKSEIYKMLVLGGLLGSESFIFLLQMWPEQRCEIMPLFSRAEVYV